MRLRTYALCVVFFSLHVPHNKVVTEFCNTEHVHRRRGQVSSSQPLKTAYSYNLVSFHSLSDASSYKGVKTTWQEIFFNKHELRGLQDPSADPAGQSISPIKSFMQGVAPPLRKEED
jgi:hypothetical protein